MSYDDFNNWVEEIWGSNNFRNNLTKKESLLDSGYISITNLETASKEMNIPVFIFFIEKTYADIILTIE
jgi:hypothetical protein